MVIWRESRGNPRDVNSLSGCTGLFQLLREHGHGRDLTNQRTNISIAGQHFAFKGWAPWAATAW